jgi:acyl CoA:acetate/3-ketoacid CoA transferase beta subunit
MMVVAAARLLRDGEVVVVGLGIPQLAADLAKLTHAPNLLCLSEIGVVDPQGGGEPGVGNADPRLWRGAVSFCSFADVMGTLLQRGRVDVGFLGALEVDRRGNVNSTEVPRASGGVRRFGGSGGANDIATHARRVVIVCRHNEQKIVERVHHVTSPGHVDNETALPGGGPDKVVTDKAVLGFGDDRLLRVESIHPGTTLEEVVACSSCDIAPDERVEVTPPPSERELELLRVWLDPARQYTAPPTLAAPRSAGAAA